MEYINKNPMIFILSGKARSGKNEAADIIYNKENLKCVKISYANYLKEYVKVISNWDGSEETKPRDLLQELGISLIKEKIDSKLLIRRVIEDIKVYSYFFDVIIITDARLLDEIEEIKANFDKVVTIRIKRLTPNNLTESQQKHITETNLDNYNNFDYEIINNDNLEHLKKEINKIVEENIYEK